MREAFELLLNRGHHLGVAVAGIEHTDAAGKIDIAFAFNVPKFRVVRPGGKNLGDGTHAPRHRSLPTRLKLLIARHGHFSSDAGRSTAPVTFSMPSVLEPQHYELPKLIGDDRQNEQDADDHLLQVGLDLRQVHSILDKANEDGAEHDIAEPSYAAAQTHAADDARGDRVERHRGTYIGLSGFEPCRQQNA